MKKYRKNIKNAEEMAHEPTVFSYIPVYRAPKSHYLPRPYAAEMKNAFISLCIGRAAEIMKCTSFIIFVPYYEAP